MGHREHSPAPPERESRPPPQIPFWLQLFLRSFARRDFVLGGLIPLGLFLVLRGPDPLRAIVAAGSWSLGLVVVDWWRARRLEGIALLTALFAGIQLVTTLLTRNAALVVWSGVLTTTLEGLVYLASVPSPRPLIQLAAEGMGATDTLPLSLRQAPMYRTAWQILTAIWGGVSLSKAGVFVLAQWWLPLDTVLLVGFLLGWPLYIGLLAFSFWFPGWYWTGRGQP